MNFLAHLWLADQARVPLAGAVLGDWFRGALPPELPADLALSVRLHRRVDVETDKHPAVRAARANFGPGMRRYAGILLDLLYDHALAIEWRRFSGEPLERFAARSAREVGGQARWFEQSGGPVPSASGFERLLLSYTTTSGLEHAMRRTAGRLRRPDGLLKAMDSWQQRLPRLTSDLPVLLEDLRVLAEAFVRGPQPPAPSP